eukprot:CAMPEP_0177709398 /NCGR_PEP_ID=MMETSP0484_2-20121128/10781_1 /TAXON_ID=354590 /ORGANISM="Rhodomonas lens, Strain RHODO" /LENGTH=894 /DNA_ID=CAMNT_0019221011 /DNA_START=35 /DNA_END=2719 /DNA_ORIENTATION=+
MAGAAPNKATVKSVLSADTVIVMGQPVGGPPPEKTITLAGIISPRLGRRDGTQKDEPFAWPAREFLRKACVGKAVTFELEETVASIGKSFGHVYLDGENLSTLIVQAGWAKVKPPMGNNPTRTAYQEELQRMEAQAQSAGIGMWSKDAGSMTTIRNVIMPGDAGYDAKDVLDNFKGQAQTLITEQFRDGATVRGYLLPSFHWVTVFLSGVSCPGFKRAEEPGGADIPEAFAQEAKYFMESRLLNREVSVVLEGVDKYNNFYGSILHPQFNISVELLKVGLAKVVDWSAKFTKDPELLYKAERLAKERRQRIWKDYVAPVRSAGAASAAEFVGKVAEVISGDFLVVKDSAMPPVEHRIALSSIRTPKLGRRDQKDEAWAWEAREFLRSRLIGRKVTVGIDYIRPLPNSTTGETERVFASVSEGANNVAVALVANGLATVMKHRQDDQDRSLYYDDLIQAEAAAARDKKGLHGDATPPTRHINDVSNSSATAQAKQMFGFVQRAGRLQGIVQHVVNGARYKVLIPKQSCVISLALAGVRCPTTGRKDGEPGEPYGEEAYAFARDKCLQHDVEVEVHAQDKIGTMIGRLYIHKQDMGVTLLKEGYARTSGRDMTNEMEEAEKGAQQKRLRTWEKYDAELEAEKAAAEAAEVVESATSGEATQVTVTEVVDAVTFYVHPTGAEQQIAYVADRLAAMVVKEDGEFRPKVGEVVCAKFSADDLWYRARVEARKGDTCSVLFIDYGNGEDVPVSRLRPLPSSVPTPVACPPQALEYKLAYIKPPKDEEFKNEAMACVQEILAASNGVVSAKMEYRERSGRCHVMMMDPASGKSFNSILLRNGLAKLERRRQDTPGLKDDQAEAKRERLCIWQYGDAVDSDEDDNRMAEDVAKAKQKTAGGR